MRKLCSKLIKHLADWFAFLLVSLFSHTK